jgi:23S rRNA (guanosine2251-2'-O)-methyltransferase
MKKKTMEGLNRLSTDDFKQVKKIPISILLDDVRSLQNIGSIFRTSDAFAIEKLYLCGITGTPPQREIERTALGATHSVIWEYYPSLKEALEVCQSLGKEIWAIEQLDISHDLKDFKPSPNIHYALIFGNEINGVSESSFPYLKGSIEIPQYGTKHSFNIAVSVGIILWDFFTKLNPS